MLSSFDEHSLRSKATCCGSHLKAFKVMLRFMDFLVSRKVMMESLRDMEEDLSMLSAASMDFFATSAWPKSFSSSAKSMDLGVAESSVVTTLFQMEFSRF